MLSKKDFRSVRKILTKKDYALDGYINYNKKRDLIDKETWDNIMNLPDTVLIETSNTYGTKIKNLNNFSSNIIEDSIYNLFKKNFEEYILLLIYDSFNSSIFNSLNGYYRESFSSLRSVLELVILVIIDKKKFHEDWMNSKEIHYKKELERSTNIIKLNNLLKSKGEGEYSLWIINYMHELSGYIHVLKNKSNYDLWKGSTGPIFVEETFLKFYKNYINILSILYISVLLNIKNNPPRNEANNIIENFFDNNFGDICLEINNIYGILRNDN